MNDISLHLEGRASRTEFFQTTLVATAIGAILYAGLAFFLDGMPTALMIGGIVLAIWYGAVMLAVSVRRLQDCGAWQVFVIVPIVVPVLAALVRDPLLAIVAAVIVVVFAFVCILTPSEPWPNHYGPVPKG